jgi:hypothetical protein
LTPPLLTSQHNTRTSTTSLLIPSIAQFPIHKHLPQCTNCLPFLHSLPSVPVLLPSFLRPLLPTCPVRLPHTTHCRRSVAEPNHPTP